MNVLRFHLLALTLSFAVTTVSCQSEIKKIAAFTSADSLRGALRPERTCYDVTHYGLHLLVDTLKRNISGYCDITFRAVSDFKTMQIDLFANYKIEKTEIRQADKTTNVTISRRKDKVIFFTLPKTLKKNEMSTLRIYYQGVPPQAKNAPWDGGFVWRKDEKGRCWLGVACEHFGASSWYPCKDHLSDEPDSAQISVAVPNGLMAVCNGQLRSQAADVVTGFTRFTWAVTYPINSYNITLNVADYAHFSDTYTALDGDSLRLNYYVLPENLEKAKKQFTQVKPMLKAYEQVLGKYPFWRDGYALVETHYLGMEHQSAIAYGNHYMRGYLGGMVPRWANFDYIIIHESGHEYWGNAISINDHAEMWIHEGFTTYMEALYVENTLGYEKYLDYLNYQEALISGGEPLVSPRDVNANPTGDIYFRGTWVLHTLRSTMGDEAFKTMLKGFYEQYKYKTVDIKDFIAFVNQWTKTDYAAFFQQYLYEPQIPVFTYKLTQIGEDLTVEYRWNCEVKAFKMPIKIGRAGQYIAVTPTVGDWQTIVLKNTDVKNFRIAKSLYLVGDKRVM